MRFLVLIILLFSFTAYTQNDSISRKVKPHRPFLPDYVSSRIKGYIGLEQFGFQFSPMINQKHYNRWARQRGFKRFWNHDLNHYVGIEINNTGIGGFGVFGYLFSNRFSLNYELSLRYNWVKKLPELSHRLHIDDIKISKRPYIFLGYFAEYNHLESWRPLNFSISWRPFHYAFIGTPTKWQGVRR